jgi:hypothetical protein
MSGDAAQRRVRWLGGVVAVLTPNPRSAHLDEA